MSTASQVTMSTALPGLRSLCDGHGDHGAHGASWRTQRRSQPFAATPGSRPQGHAPSTHGANLGGHGTAGVTAPSRPPITAVTTGVTALTAPQVSFTRHGGHGAGHVRCELSSGRCALVRVARRFQSPG